MFFIMQYNDDNELIPINDYMKNLHVHDVDKILTPDKNIGGGKRFNEGKTRFDLAPTFAQEQYAKVLTIGAEKYGEKNWQLGMKWSKVLASLERHLQAIKSGVDYDHETGLLHSAHVMCNAAFLTEYYRIFPQGDDRSVEYLNRPKIGLDIDEVICDWAGAWCKEFGYDTPLNWNFSYSQLEHFNSFTPEKLNEFYLNIPAKMNPADMPFEPHCYITSRSVPVELTKAWLQKNGFPTMPVYSVGFGKSKVQVAKESGIDIFVDDRYENFVELTNAGIFTYLYDAPHNQRYNVGHRRIKSLKEIVE